MSSDPLIVNVSEAKNIGYELVQAVATDADDGINAQIVYAILPSGDANSGLFHIDPMTGWIALSKRLGKGGSVICSVTNMGLL